jgi:hypothetical protein
MKMKPIDHIKSHDLDLITDKVQGWWNQCERCYRDAAGEPLDWDAYFLLNEERVEMIVQEMLLDTHPTVLEAGGFRNLAIELLDIFEDELHPQMYYIEEGVAAVYDWLKPQSN